MVKVLVLGLGIVGKAIYDIIFESSKYEVYGYDINPKVSINKLDEIPRSIDILHICYPCFNKSDFIKTTVDYVSRFKPNLVIIHSTIPPGTTEEIYMLTNVDIVHSPVRGIHRKMKEHLRFWIKWIGAINENAAKKAKEHLESLGFKVKVVLNPRITELAKILETTYRALLITFWHEVHRMCKYFNVDLIKIAEFIGEVHEVLKDRPIYWPDVIGGHCLIPNTKLLLSEYRSKLLEYILESNEKRIQEIQDDKIRKEVEELKNFVIKNFLNKEYFGLS